MQQIKQIKQYNEYIQTLREMLEPAKKESEGEKKELIEQAMHIAQKIQNTITSPVKIGVVGEFSAGKSLLIGALFGYADMLPVSEIPTTGNVTRLRFKQHQDEKKDEIRRSSIESYRIDYIDHTEAKQALAYMLQELESRASQIKIPPPHLAKLQKLRTEEAPSISAIHAWCQESWDLPNNPAFRTLLREVVLFVRAYSHCHPLLGQSYEVGEQIAREGLTLPVSRTNLSTDNFQSIPQAPPKLEKTPTALDPTLIRNTFHLIRRCEIVVSVSKKIWDLSPVKDQNDFILIDFPGLGAETSGVRDAFLCLREMEDVQTILLLLNAKQPGAGEAQQIFTLMQQHKEDLQDRVLVGVSRFNQLPIKADAWAHLEAKIPSNEASSEEDEEDPLSLLGASHTASENNLRESDVYASLSVLEVLVSSARALTARMDRVVFLSPPLYLQQLRQQHPELPVASSGYSKEMEEAIRDALYQQQRFQRVIGALKTSGNANQLTRWLEQAYAPDGGVVALRKLFQQHVAEHGLQQILDQAIRGMTSLQQVIRKLRDLLAKEAQQQPIPQETKHLQTLQNKVSEVLQAFLTLDVKFNNESIDFVLHTQQRDLPLAQVTEEEVTARFYRWPIWQAMLRSISDEGYLHPSENQTSDSIINNTLIEVEDIPEDKFADTSEDFLSLFVQECRELEVWLQPCIEKSLQRWLENIAVEISAYQSHLAPAIQRAQQHPSLTAKQKQAIKVLQAAFSMETLLPTFLQMVLLKTMDKEDISRWQKIFPLHLGQKFAWHKEVMAFCPAPQRHQSMVMRIREELIASALRELNELLSQALQTAKQSLRSTLKQIITTLSQIHLDAKFLYLLSEIPSSPENSSEEAQLPLLSRLAALRNPLETP